MNTPNLNSVLERQLLLQLGDRLKRLRKSQGLGTVEMSEKAGITRNTLRAVETGDPKSGIGNYLRVMSVLGVSGELALLCGDTMIPAPADSAAAQSKRDSPFVNVFVSSKSKNHQIQDFQSLVFHEEATKLIKKHPELVIKARNTLESWLRNGNSRSTSLWLEWQKILAMGTWRKVLSQTRHAQQLRQASPLVTILPESDRLRIISDVRKLKNGLDISGYAGEDQSLEICNSKSAHDTRTA